MTTTSQRWRFTGAAIAVAVLAGGLGTSPAHAGTGKQGLLWRQFDEPGWYEFDLPKGVDSFTVTMIGGGGGGGGAGREGTGTGGGGGGGGGAGIADCTVTKFPADRRTIGVRVGGGGGGGQKGGRQGEFATGGGGKGGAEGGGGGVPGNRNDGGGAGGGGGGGSSAAFFVLGKASGAVVSVGAAGGGGGGGGGAGWAPGEGPARGGSGGSGHGGARGGQGGSDARKTPIGGHAGAGGSAQCDNNTDVTTTGTVANGTNGGDADKYTAGTAGVRPWFPGLPDGLIPKRAGRGAAGGSGGTSTTDGATARGGCVIVTWNYPSS
ncbi:hypothetical protein [Kitasatospora sp. NPDC056273]|uniref:hypothetical protein n=1 Tax=Kitasatospora sp. NPDC056273 TaxID=3345769 RepID=UPI0035DDF1D2